MKDYLGEPEAALELYKQTLDIKEILVGKESPYYALVLINIASTYSRLNQATEALKALNRGIAIYNKLPIDDVSTDYGSAMTKYAALKRNAGEYSQALKADQKALELQSHVYGQQHVSYCLALTSLGMTQMAIGLYKQANKTFESCLLIQEKVLGKNHPDYANTLIYLVSAREELSLYEGSEKLALEAIEIMRSTYSKNSLEYARSLNILAHLQFQQSQFNACEKTYKESLKTLENTVGETDSEYATVLCNQSLLYTAIGSYDKAKAACNKAKAILDNYADKPHIYTFILMDLYMFMAIYLQLPLKKMILL